MGPPTLLNKVNQPLMKKLVALSRYFLLPLAADVCNTIGYICFAYIHVLNLFSSIELIIVTYPHTRVNGFDCFVADLTSQITVLAFDFDFDS